MQIDKWLPGVMFRMKMQEQLLRRIGRLKQGGMSNMGVIRTMKMEYNDLYIILGQGSMKGRLMSADKLMGLMELSSIPYVVGVGDEECASQ